VSDCRQ